jgi:hypothetical protein
MAFDTMSDRRAAHGDALAAALLDAPEGVHFDDLLAAAPGADAGEVAGWLGHAVLEGMARDRGGGLYQLKARGRRLLTARRRRLSGERSGPPVPPV